MKEKRRYKRFDLFSTLAAMGTLAVLLFESIFVFELYTRKFEPIERLIAPAVESATPEQPVTSNPVG